MPTALIDSPGVVVECLLGPTVAPPTVTAAPENGGIPAAPGLYAWWVVRGAISDVPERLHPTEPDRSLLYVGISPARPTSSQLLRGRVCANHLGGNTGGSTFRLTLASLLFEKRGWKPVARGAKALISGTDNAELSGWQRQHLTLTWAVRERPWEIEADLIATMQPPLNLAANTSHEFHAAVRGGRDRFRRAARRAP